MSKLTISAVILVALAVSAANGSVRYDNYSVYRLRPNNVAQLLALQRLAVEEEGVDFWREPDRVNHFADIMLTPENRDRMIELFNSIGLQHELIITDVAQLIEREKREQTAADDTMALYARANYDEAIPGFWNKYQRLNQHVALIDALAAANPSLVSRLDIGQSYEKRTISAMVIGVNQNTAKPVIWIEGGIHAREWISPATVTYFGQELVSLYNAKDADAVKLLETFNFIIVPVLNVDGYEFTHTDNRLWRKTRRPSDNKPSCIGADPNRNFGYQWGGTGASTNPCAETYRGDSAFSELEVKAETDYILKNLKNRVKAFLSVHSYGQYFLYPWGYTSAVTKDDAELNRVAKLSVAALNKVSPSTKYTIGTSTNVLYAAAGGADDWSYGSAGVTYSYTVELRDTGYYGFQLPASQIIPTGRETSAAFIALAKAVMEKL